MMLSPKPKTWKTEEKRKVCDLIKAMEVEVATRRGNLLWAELRGEEWEGGGQGKPMIFQTLVRHSSVHGQDLYARATKE